MWVITVNNLVWVMSLHDLVWMMIVNKLVRVMNLHNLVWRISPRPHVDDDSEQLSVGDEPA